MTATLATGGLVGPLAAIAAAGITSFTVDVTEAATSNKDLTWESVAEAGKSAVLTSLFTAIGMGASVAGQLAKQAVIDTGKTFFGKSLVSWLAGQGTEIGLDASLSFTAASLFGQDTTIGDEVVQSAMGQLMSYAIAGGSIMKMLGRGDVPLTAEDFKEGVKKVAQFIPLKEPLSKENLEYILELNKEQLNKNLRKINKHIGGLNLNSTELRLKISEFSDKQVDLLVEGYKSIYDGGKLTDAINPKSTYDEKFHFIVDFVKNDINAEKIIHGFNNGQLTFNEISVYLRERFPKYKYERIEKVCFGKYNDNKIIKGVGEQLECVEKDVFAKITGSTSSAKCFESGPNPDIKNFPIYFYDKNKKYVAKANNKEEATKIAIENNFIDGVNGFWDNGHLLKVYNETSVGDAVCIGDNMYIRTDDGLKDWNMTKDIYDKLFPLVERYSIVQNNGTCWLSAVFAKLMITPEYRISIYERFSLNSQGKLYCTLANGTSVCFEDLKILPYITTDPKYSIDSECLGLQMLEETMALYVKGEGDFGIDLTDIDLLVLNGGPPNKALKEVFGIETDVLRTRDLKEFISLIENNDCPVLSLRDKNGGHAVANIEYFKDSDSLSIYNTQYGKTMKIKMKDLSDVYEFCLYVPRK